MTVTFAGLVWLVVLLLVNAFFVGAEFAVISARRSQIEPLADAGSKAAQTTLWAMEHATLMLATTQLGHHRLLAADPERLRAGDPPPARDPAGPDRPVRGPSGSVAFVVALALVTFLHVVFGEMVPKNLSFSVPDRAALMLAPPLVFVARVFKPIIFA